MTEPLETIEQLYERERGKPMPGKFHSLIQTNICAALRVACRKTYSIHSKLSLDLSGFLVTPDVSVYYRSDITFDRDELKMTTPPLLVIEIISPTQSQYSVVTKIEEMLKNGVKAAWFVQPFIQAVSVFIPNQKPKTFTEGIVRDGVTGIEIPVSEIFTTE
jgi:Uma2 family endonuclease